MNLWTFLMSLWAAIGPYITPANITALEAAVTKAITDFNGGNYAAVVADLIAAFKVIIPGAAEKLDSLAKMA